MAFDPAEYDILEPKSHALRVMQDYGWTPEQAAGIVGNLIHESDLNTGAVGDSGASFGIAQWNGERRKGLENFAAAQGADLSNFDTQLDYIHHELQTSESGAGQALRQAKDVESATKIFSEHFERPGKPMMDSRLSHAKGLLNTIGDYLGPASAEAGQFNPADYEIPAPFQKNAGGFNPADYALPAKSWADSIGESARYWKDNIEVGWRNGYASPLYNTLANLPMLLNKLREAGGKDYGMPPDFRGGPGMEGVPAPPVPFGDTEQALRETAQGVQYQGKPSAPDLKASSKDWLDWGEFPGKEIRTDVGSQVIQGLAAAPGQVAMLAGPVKYLGPVGGFGATNAFQALDKGVIPAIEGGIKGAVLGLGFKGVEPLIWHEQVLGLGALGALQAAIDGGGPKEITSGALTMMALGSMARGGSKTAREMLRDAYEEFKPKYEAAKGQAAILQGEEKLPPPIVQDQPLMPPEVAYQPIAAAKLEGVRPQLLDGLAGLAQEYQERFGEKLNIVSGRRSTEHQAELYAAEQAKNPGSKMVAQPGNSRHESGDAIDLDKAQASRIPDEMLARYGLYRPHQGQGASGIVEPWHIERDPQAQTAAAVASGEAAPEKASKLPPGVGDFMGKYGTARGTQPEGLLSGQEPLSLGVSRVPTEEIATAPEVFQYKLGADEKTGAGLALGDAGKWDEGLSGVLTLWRDPEGKLFVVNGHQRLALAQRTGAPEVRAQILDSSEWSQPQARAYGAKINIAEGRGTALDAAKFVRDTGMTGADLAAAGLSLSEAKTRQALALSKLADPLFHETTLGRVPLDRAVLIGEELAGREPAQEALLRYLKKLEGKGQELSNAKLRELIRLGQSTGQTPTKQQTLFGVKELEQSHMLQAADLAAYAKQQLSRDKNLFGVVGRQAERLEAAGNTIDLESNQAISRQAALSLDLFNKVAYYGDTATGKVLAEYAEKLSLGGNQAQIRKDAYAALKDALGEDRARFGLDAGGYVRSGEKGPGIARPDVTGRSPGEAARAELQAPEIALASGGPKPTAFANRLTELQTEYPGIDPDRASLVLRTFPDADNGQIANMVADPEMYAQVAKGNLPAQIQAELLKKAGDAGRQPSFEGMGDQGGLFGGKPGLGEEGFIVNPLAAGKEVVDGFINKYQEHYAEPTEPELVHWGKAKTEWIGKKNTWGFQAFLEAQAQKDLIRQYAGEKRYGPKSKALAEAIYFYNEYRINPEYVEKNYAKLPPEVQKAVDKFTLIESDPELMAIVDRIKTRSDQMGRFALDEGVIKNLIENHGNRIYAPEPEQIGPPHQANTKFASKSRHRLERKYESVFEAMVEGDKKLLIKDATTNQMILGEELAHVIADKQLLKENSALFSSRGGEGLARINHPNFKSWEYSGNINLGPIMEEARRFTREPKREEGLRNLLEMRGLDEAKVDEYLQRLGDKQNALQALKDLQKEVRALVNEDTPGTGRFLRRDFVVDNATGDVLRRADLFAPQAIAKEINNILGQSQLAEWAPARLATKYGAIWKASTLSYSLFHPQAFIRNLATNPERFWNILSPRKYYQEGWDSIREMSPRLELGYQQGLVPFKGAVDWAELRPGDKTVFGELLDSHPATKFINEMYWAGIKKNVDFTFLKLGNAYKAQFFLDSLRYAERKNPGVPIEELAKGVADYCNNVWGGLNEPLKGTNPVAIHAERLLLLARDWTRSNLNLFVDAFGPGAKGQLSRQYWLTALGKTFAATTILNLAMSLGDDLSAWERFRYAYEAGNLRVLDADITPLYRFACDLTGKTPDDVRMYFRVGGHFYDVFKMIFDTGRFIHDKGSIIARMVMEHRSGRDWRGRVFTTIGELTGMTGTEEMEPLRGKLTKQAMGNEKAGVSWGQTPSYALNQAKQILPIPVQNLVTYLGGELDGFEALAKSTGTRVSSARARTEAEKVMSEYYRAHTPAGTPVEQELRTEKGKLFDLITKEKNPAKFGAELDNMLQQGKITLKAHDNAVEKATWFLEDPKYGRLTWGFKQIPASQFGAALRVYEAANPEERQVLAPLMDEKWMKVTPEMAAKYEQKVNELTGARP